MADGIAFWHLTSTDRDDMNAKNKRIYWVIPFAVYLIILFKITVVRNGFDLAFLFQRGKLNLLPFVELISTLQKDGLYRFLYFFIGNIIWFVPFGF